MVNLYADLVQKGLYTTEPELAVDGIRLVPITLRAQVAEEVARREALRGTEVVEL